ncbi:SclB protein [Bacteroides graminisolvens DSM 19988 = JCM 15093]|uniref:SclB protein n=1 Tax=Bacteroides graminisolvens DSM 19988 = JCM 15093 TaxID=1121097 RepID=A0A069D2U0_9BACE|nr:SclB protein [Bacteroides graminisolvens DSM 19988 = JCM 15093]
MDYWDFLTGRDGLTPHVGTNGNWYIGDKDTGVKAAGKDGLDGKDGKPGEPGKPGAEVTIIKGVPNVIAQYSQSEFGEMCVPSVF